MIQVGGLQSPPPGSGFGENMKDVNGNVLRDGARVKLAKPDSRYNLGMSNPAIGTRWECAGRYVGGGQVHWESGAPNSYKDYELIDLDYPCISIWET